MYPYRSSKGQGLIETMVALFFIAFSLVALIRFQGYLAYNNSVTQQQADAVSLATKQIETLRDFHTIVTTTGYTAYNDIASGSSTYSGINTTYTIAWTVTAFTNPTYKRISVTVSWTDRRNQAQSVTLINNVAGVNPSYSAAVM
jgi:Tfp pilus assembly protein PilV